MAFFGLSALCCVLATLFPISPQAPVELERVLAAVGAVAALAIALVGARMPRAGLHTAAALATLCISVLLSQSHTNGGLMMTAWAYAWLAVYAALVFPPREIRLHAAFITVGCGAGVAVAGLPGTLVEFLIIAITVWAAALAVGSMSERLRSQADTDHLTGLLNRNGFVKAATRELGIAQRTGYPLALGIVDLDDFKRVNDAHGHAAGDLLLTQLADAWRRALRPGDLVARLGGDEFVVLFPATGPADARNALARLRDAHDAGWSVGVVAWEPGETLAACLARADGRLYEAKGERLPEVSGAA
jgi:diguanylate cyclase (GGDEF)-like protein